MAHERIPFDDEFHKFKKKNNSDMSSLCTYETSNKKNETKQTHLDANMC